MQRVWLMNGNNISYDKDFTASILAMLNDGVIDTWLGTSGTGASATVLAGKALIECLRTNGEKVMVFYENTASVTVDLSGTKKLYIEVNQAKLDDGTLNSEDGSWIGAISTGASYPSTNYIPLASITGGVITDARETVSFKSLLWKGYGVNKTVEIDLATGNQVLKDVTNGSVPADTDTFRVRNTAWDYVDLTYQEIRTDLANLITNVFTGTTTDTLVTNSPACIGYDDKIYNIPATDMGSFTVLNAGGVGTYITQRYLWSNTYLFGYMRSTTVYARAATLVDWVWTYGTEVALRTGMTANTIVLSAVMNTDKVLIWWYESGTSIGYIICTVSWVTTSIGAVVTQWTWWSGTGNMVMDKIDTDRFIIVMNSGSDSRYMIGTVSGTVPSPWSYTAIGTNTQMKVAYLANWYAWIMFQSGTTIAHRVIYSASGTTTTTTFTLADSSAVTAQGAICRFDSTSYAYYNGGTTVTKITIPWAWTTLVSSSLITWLSAIVNCEMASIADNIVSLLSTTAWYIFQWSKTLLTFTWVWILATWTVSASNAIFDWKYVMYCNSSSANWVPSYLSILVNQIIGVIQSNSAIVLVNWAISVAVWLITWSRYYSWNPLTTRPNATNVPVWIALSATKLLVQ